MHTLRKGFTLVELLVVIGIIMILSVAFLATINPLEQTDRAKDYATRTLASDFIDASRHFVASTQYSPQCSTASCASPDAVGTLDTMTAINSRLYTNNNAQSATSFTSSPYATRVTVSRSSATFDGVFTACWKPNSLSERSKRTAGDRAHTVWTSSGAACTPDTDNTNCYQCIWQ